MMHIDLKPEPPDFDERVRKPGNAFLEMNPNPTSKEWSSNNYWNRCSPQLYAAYGGICAYTGQWFPQNGSTSVDHFLPKSRYQEKAYEWDNYRLTTQKMNGYKSDKVILDPFEINNGDFVLDFPSCLLKPRNDMTPAEKSKVVSTIKILHLNEEEQVEQRCRAVMQYITKDISKHYLQMLFPFVAAELERQNLFDTIGEIMKMPQFHS